MFNDMYNNKLTPDAFEEAPNDDDIETTMLAWYRLANTYSEQAEEFANDLYEQLSKIKCDKVLRNQIIRIGKTQFRNHFLNNFSEEDLKDLKETLLFQIDNYQNELFDELIAGFEESDTENIQSEENESDEINE